VRPLNVRRDEISVVILPFETFEVAFDVPSAGTVRIWRHDNPLLGYSCPEAALQESAERVFR
jgi:hypothetical protein